MRLARDSMIAAGKVMSEHPRSACSRFYYAAYAAAHAMLMHLGETPDREMGTWSHKTLPDHVRACLARNGRRPEEKRAIDRLSRRRHQHSAKEGHGDDGQRTRHGRACHPHPPQPERVADVQTVVGVVAEPHREPAGWAVARIDKIA